MKTKLFSIMSIVFYFSIIHPVAASYTQVYPDSFNDFRETVYMQSRDLSETIRLYTTAKQDIENILTDVQKYLALSRCEYLMGISSKASGRENESATFFEQGIVWAEESLAIRPTSEGYRILGTNISFLCEVRRSYGLRNFGKIEENARKALELDPHNLMAQHLLASKFIVAPWPFADVRRGAALLEEITRQNYLTLEKEDLFGLYLLLEAACIKQKKNQEAQIWHEKAVNLYPTAGIFVSLLLKVN